MVNPGLINPCGEPRPHEIASPPPLESQQLNSCFLFPVSPSPAPQPPESQQLNSSFLFPVSPPPHPQNHSNLTLASSFLSVPTPPPSPPESQQLNSRSLFPVSFPPPPPTPPLTPESQQLNSCSLFPVSLRPLFFCYPSFVFFIVFLLYQPIHLNLFITLFNKPVCNIRMRKRVQWLDGHTHKNLSNMVTPNVLAGE